MDVYKVTPASYSAPQAGHPEQFVSAVGLGAFSGTPMLARWSKLELEAADPALLADDFFYFGLGGLAFPLRTLEVFKSLFESIGELLPFAMSGAPGRLTAASCVPCCDRGSANRESLASLHLLVRCRPM